MTYTTTTATALTLSIASIVVALGIDASLSGGTGPVVEESTPTTTTAPARREVAIEAERLVDTAATLETEIIAETSELHERIEWGLARYAEANLDLPTMVIYGHIDRAACKGLVGYFSRTDAGNFEVHTCGTEFTLLHELGHAWAAANLDESTKAEFMELAAADEWIGETWLTSGSEHAANTLAWGLMDTRINQTRTMPKDHASMLEAFSILTGGDEPLWMES